MQINEAKLVKCQKGEGCQPGMYWKAVYYKLIFLGYKWKLGPDGSTGWEVIKKVYSYGDHQYQQETSWRSCQMLMRYLGQNHSCPFLLYVYFCFSG